jgi:hypothetical protein
MRHFILLGVVFACPVAVRPRRVSGPAAAARLVAPPRSVQRPPTRAGRAVSAVNVAPIAIAADEHLNAAARLCAQEQPGLRPVIMVAPAALVMRPPMAWTRAAVTAMMPLQSCLCAV